MKKLLPALLLLVSACSPTRTVVKHLGPVIEPAKAPATCELLSVLPDSPAQKAGIRVGEVLLSVNGTQPTDAAAVSDLVQNSGSKADLEIRDAAGKTRHVKVALNKERPRLGASCDLSGWRKSSVSAAGNEAVTVFQGSFALTLSGIVDKGMTFIRARVTNNADHPLLIHTDLFTATDGQKTPLKVLTPHEVIYFMHGEDAVSMIKPPAPADGAPPTVQGVPADSLIRQLTPPRRGKDHWSRSDEQYVQSNVAYLNKESLWSTRVEPGKMADGLIYFLEPKSLPVTIQAKLEDHALAVSFGEPTPSTQRMSMDELAKFFEEQKKGTALRLTLKNGKVFAGKYSSYDALNEIVWFDTPSGVVLTTSSFGLKHIAFAEVMSPEQKKQPTVETPN